MAGPGGGYFGYQDRQIVGVEDLVLLSDISERGIVKNLDLRFQKDQIYTYLGNVLIVCNPFKWLPLYDANYVQMFNRGQLQELEPHIYAIAERAFKDMLLEDFNQCVIISGESGAGKTEAAKQIMSYVAAVSGSGGNDANVNKVKSIILDSNPALESFGNAMTLRNNNSSRFGKYFEINFSASGTPMGGRITNFLLERGRLNHLGQGERSFHIFYQLLQGGNSQLKQRLCLGSNPNEYSLLSMSGVTTVNNEGGSRNDGQDLEETLMSLQTVGVYGEDQAQLFAIVAAVLHLSNIQFRDKNINGAEGCDLASQQAQQAVQLCANVLQLDPQALLFNLSYKTLITIAPGKGMETFQVPQNAVQAAATRDSLAKDIYAKMFDLLVVYVNESLKQGGEKTRASVRRQMRASAGNMGNSGTLSIGVLDIYGFEIFRENFFEQFCINYVNEKLQQVFIELTIRAEQEDYESEGIAWNRIPFFDNKVVCELIEGPIGSGGGKKAFGAKATAGVFDILNDTAKTVTAMEAAVADRRFQDGLFAMHSSHPHLKKAPTGFVVIHYAGDVSYSIDGFVDANRDTLSKELILMLQNSRLPIFRKLYPDQVDYNDKTQPPSTGTKVKRQANDLIDRLKMCEPHYVRTIKSNKAPRVFESDMVSHQVKYLNLLENVKIRRAGFAYRVKFLDFNRKFKVFGIGTVDTQFYARATPYDITMKFMQVAAQRLPQLNQPGEVQMGNTKLFIKTPEVLFELQKLRRNMLGEIATKIQRFYRYYKAQKKLFDMKTYMIELFERAGKPTTPVDVLGNYQAFYIDDSVTKQWIDDIVGYYREQQMVQEKIKYTDVVKRVGKNPEFPMEDIVFVMTDQAFYVMRWEEDTTVKPASKMMALFSKKATIVPKVDQFGQVQRKLVLKKRVPYEAILDLNLTTLADDLLKIGVQPQMALQKPDKTGFVDKASVKRCMQSQEPFSFFGKTKNRCHFTGGLYVKEVMSSACVPERGFYEPVPVLATVSNKFNTEMLEDVIISSEHKAEITALFMDLVSKFKSGGGIEDAFNKTGGYNRGPALAPNFSNQWQSRGAEPLGFNPGGMISFMQQNGVQQVTFQYQPEGGLLGMIPASGVSADRQRKLKEFLYKREENKKRQAQNRRLLNDQARLNQQRFAEEDKRLRQQQREERRQRRQNGNKGPVAQVGYSQANSQPAFNASNSNPFGSSQPAFGASTGGSSRNNFGGGSTNNTFGGGSSNNNFGGGSSKPAFGGGASNTFGGSSKPSFGGGGSDNSRGGAPSKPVFGGNKPAFGGGSSNNFGGSSKPAFGGGSNNFGSNNNSSKPSFGNNNAAESTGFGNKNPFGGAGSVKDKAAGIASQLGGGGFNKPSNSNSNTGGGGFNPSSSFNAGGASGGGFQPSGNFNPSGNAGGGFKPSGGFNPSGNSGGGFNPGGFNQPSGGGFGGGAPPPAPKRTDGEDWERVFDPNTGRYYFFNYKTQESVWDES